MGTWERNPKGLQGFAQQIFSTKVPWLHETVGVQTRLCVEVKPKNLWEWNGEKRSYERRPGTEMCPWTPGSAGCLWFHRLFSKTYLQLVTRWGLKATWARLSVWSSRDLSSDRKVSVMFHLNQSHVWYYVSPHLCVWKWNGSSLSWMSYKKTKKGIGCEMWARFTDSPCVTLNQWQPGPHARNSKSNSAAWWRWTQPWLVGSIDTHTHRRAHTLSLLFTEEYHVAKPEKPWQTMAYRLPASMVLVPLPLMGVNHHSLTLSHLPSLPGSHMSFGWLNHCLYKKRFTLNSSFKLPATPWLCNSLVAQPWQSPTWPKRLSDPWQGLHNKCQTRQCQHGYGSMA